MPPESAKKKLTLSVDEDVIAKAKEVGLNLSEITESVLRGFAFAPTDFEKTTVRGKYKELFDTMVPLLRSYDTKVQVSENFATGETGYEPEAQGEVEYYTRIELLPNGTLQWLDKSKVLLDDIDPATLLEPKEILQNFIKVIVEADKLTQRIEGLEMAKKIVQVVSESLKPSHNKEAKQKDQS